jgi:hypothetical protein
MDMQTSNHQQPEDEAFEAPAGLVSALRNIPKETIFVPATLDESILRAAQRHLRGPQDLRVRWWRLLPWVAATALLVFLAVLPQLKKSGLTQTTGVAFVREDVNQDGHVDILDAFALARQLKAGAALPVQLDLNGDGVIDERDVAKVAADAVSLQKGGRS